MTIDANAVLKLLTFTHRPTDQDRLGRLEGGMFLTAHHGIRTRIEARARGTLAFGGRFESLGIALYTFSTLPMWSYFALVCWSPSVGSDSVE